jgi:ElaA protein
MEPTDRAPIVQRASFSELTTGELHAILRLRSDVFVVDQACAYADIDGRDEEPATVHHWIEREGRIVSYGRTLAEPDGVTRIGRVVTAANARGTGLAGALVATLAAGIGGVAVLNAQAHLCDWYARFGFEMDGPEYVEDGIAHVPMRRGPRS